MTRDENPHELPTPKSLAWLDSRINSEAIELERLELEIEAARRRLGLRAMTCWEPDRRAEVEELAAGLKKNPALVVAKLQQSVFGCDWLISRWRMVASLDLDNRESIPAALRGLIRDLLGVPAEFRGEEALDPLAPGRTVAEMARTQIAELERQKGDGLEDINQIEREDAEQGLDVRGDKALAALKREHAACHRRLQWAYKERKAAERAKPSPSQEVSAQEVPASSATRPQETFPEIIPDLADGSRYMVHPSHDDDGPRDLATPHLNKHAFGTNGQAKS